MQFLFGEFHKTFKMERKPSVELRLESMGGGQGAIKTSTQYSRYTH